MFTLKVASILLIACAGLLGQVENTAIFGIGMRITGDQLLVKDVLRATAAGVDENPTIGFNYAIPEPITYIEILSQENVQAEVNFSYQNDLVEGSVVASATNSTEQEEEMRLVTALATKPFEVLITIYGFNDTMLNVNPAHILNRDQQFRGMLLPLDEDEDDFEEDYVNESADGLETFDDDSHDVDADGDGIVDDEDDDDFGADEDNFVFESADKLIEVGHRQPGDHLLYDTYQTSTVSTEEHTNHSVIFYYIDSNFITYARFIVFDHNADVLSTEYNPPVAEYSHFSPKTLKATVTDFNTTNLFVQMLLYGYGPRDLPNTYQPFLHSESTLSMEDDAADANAEEDSTLSSLQRLRILMNAKAREAVINDGETLEGVSSTAAEAVGQVAGENVCSEGENCSGVGDGCVGTGSMSVGLSLLISLLAGAVGNAMFIVRRQI